MLEEPRQEPGRGGRGGRGGAWDHFTLSDSEGLGSKTQNNGVLDGWEERGPGQGRGVPRMGQASMGVADWQLDQVYGARSVRSVWDLWMQLHHWNQLAGRGQRRGRRGSSAIEPPTMLSSLYITARSAPSPPWGAFRDTPWHLGQLHPLVDAEALRYWLCALLRRPPAPSHAFLVKKLHHRASTMNNKTSKSCGKQRLLIGHR